MMPQPDDRCQCKRWPMTSGCKQRMTQEDLLCDDCRAAKCGQLAWNGGEQPPMHVRFAGFKFRPQAQMVDSPEAEAAGYTGAYRLYPNQIEQPLPPTLDLPG